MSLETQERAARAARLLRNDRVASLRLRDELRQYLLFFVREIDEWRPNWTSFKPLLTNASLDRRDCIALVPAAQRHERVEEIAQDLLAPRAVAASQRLVKF